MFTHPEVAWMLAKEQRLAALKAAENYRILRVATQSQPSATKWPTRFMWRLGAWMVTTGSWMQRHHQPMETFAVSTSEPVTERYNHHAACRTQTL